jgi:hypothetical protein
MKITKITSLVLVAALLVAISASSASAGLIGSWDFNEGSGAIAADSTANANDGVSEVGNTRGAPATWGLDGTKGYFVSDNNQHFNYNDADPFFDMDNAVGFTAEVWARIPNNTVFEDTQENILIGKSNFANVAGWAITTQIKPTGVERFKFYINGITAYSPHDVPGGIDPNHWYHVAMVFDPALTEGGKSMRAYVDGVEVNSKTTDPALAAFTTTAELLVGDGFRPGQFEKWIDEARMHDNALSSADIVASFNAGPTPVPAGLLGDINGDGQVDGLDLNILGANWQDSPTTLATGDINGDGTTDGLDLNLLGSNWQAGVPAPGAAIPEPASLALLGLGAMAMLRRLGGLPPSRDALRPGAVSLRGRVIN